MLDDVASTRAVYDYSAGYYASAVGTTVTPAFERPQDRAVLAAFAEDVGASDRANVVDIGCGVGRITSFLHDSGLRMSGIDISHEMVRIAQLSHPHLPFAVSTMTDLPLPDDSLAGAVLWYSIIHTAPPDLASVWSELARVLCPFGRVLLAFQAGDDDVITRPDAYGSGTPLTWYRHDLDNVAASIGAFDFILQSRTWRRAELAHETTGQAFLTFQRAR
jgi:SAM-dependent methyltransferase